MRELLQRCKDDDTEAITTLVRRFRTKALDLAGAILRDDYLAQDAVQQAFLTALRRLDDLREPAAFPGWFRQIVRSECTGILRRRREQPAADTAELVSEALTPSEYAQREDRCRVVRQALAALPDISRTAAEMFYLDECTCADIGSRLNIPVGTVKRRLFDARERLRGVLLGYVAESSTDPGRDVDSDPRLLL
jgi:RNA polymerase sigma factor (sigma-70 family)